MKKETIRWNSNKKVLELNIFVIKASKIVRKVYWDKYRELSTFWCKSFLYSKSIKGSKFLRIMKVSVNLTTQVY